MLSERANKTADSSSLGAGNAVQPRKRVLVTGGAGFLGSHLCRFLVAKGYEVVCLDRFSTGRMENVADLTGHPLFRVVGHDIIYPFRWKERFDEIYNLACPASPPFYQADPIDTVKTNVIGSINMLELACEHGAKILQASTSEVYGDPLAHPQKESYWGNVNPIGIRACYDVGKRCAETLFFDYHRCHGVVVRVARIFNTYGPNMRPDDGRIVSNFVVQALEGRELTVYGDGSQTRSFCYVDDMVRGLVSLMEADSFPTKPINLGTTFEFTMLELAKMVIGLTGSRSRIVHYPLPSDDPKQRRPDLTLAKTLLNWSPQVQFEDGLRKTIRHFDKLLREQFREEMPLVS